MRKLILASVAVLGFAGVAAAQEAPDMAYGNPNISNSDRGAPVDLTTTASVDRTAEKSADVVNVGPGFDVNANFDYSGR